MIEEQRDEYHKSICKISKVYRYLVRCKFRDTTRSDNLSDHTVTTV